MVTFHFTDNDYWTIRNGLELAIAQAENIEILNQDAPKYQQVLESLDRQYEGSVE